MKALKEETMFKNYNSLIETHIQDIDSICKSFFNNYRNSKRIEEEDLKQEIYLKLLECYRNGEVASNNVKKIIRNTCIDYINNFNPEDPIGLVEFK